MPWPQSRRSRHDMQLGAPSASSPHVRATPSASRPARSCGRRCGWRCADCGGGSAPATLGLNGPSSKSASATSSSRATTPWPSHFAAVHANRCFYIVELTAVHEVRFLQKTESANRIDPFLNFVHSIYNLEVRLCLQLEQHALQPEATRRHPFKRPKALLLPLSGNQNAFQDIKGFAAPSPL